MAHPVFQGAAWGDLLLLPVVHQPVALRREYSLGVTSADVLKEINHLSNVASQHFDCYALTCTDPIYMEAIAMATATSDLPKTADMLAAMRALNELTLSNAETMIKLQSSSYEKYSTLALDALQEAASVSDFEGSKSFLTKQGELSKRIAADLTGDMETYADLGNRYLAEVQKIMSASMGTYGAAEPA